MKYYETSYEDYIQSLEKYNLHNELNVAHNSFPNKLGKLENLIVYGPSGVGKYTQVLYLLKKYSPSDMKYEKKMIAHTDKQEYSYKISDIHYEIDMSLLGCNSKILWHELFFQIVDIISVKQEKIGVLLCKNFHLIHTELLEIFYSYMQQYNNSQSNIKLIFILITEHISFIPNKILNVCHKLNIGRPTKDAYMNLSLFNNKTIDTGDKLTFINKMKVLVENKLVKNKKESLANEIETDGVINIKELYPLSSVSSSANLPTDSFNVICDNIIKKIMNPKDMNYSEFRDNLYDMLTYNLEIPECLFYILKYLIENKLLKREHISEILSKSYTFLKYYNNNYRPIYHLESIMYYILIKLNEL
jgi:hypothetical protein